MKILQIWLINANYDARTVLVATEPYRAPPASKGNKPFFFFWKKKVKKLKSY